MAWQQFRFGGVSGKGLAFFCAALCLANPDSGLGTGSRNFGRNCAQKEK